DGEAAYRQTQRIQQKQPNRQFQRHPLSNVISGARIQHRGPVPHQHEQDGERHEQHADRTDRKQQCQPGAAKTSLVVERSISRTVASPAAVLGREHTTTTVAGCRFLDRNWPANNGHTSTSVELDYFFPRLPKVRTYLMT